ncbi:MAG: hypothetical protein ACXWR0_13330 [Bdellovibrio sp.]
MGKQVVELLRKKKGLPTSASTPNNNNDSDEVGSNTGCDSNFTPKSNSDSNASLGLNLKTSHGFDFINNSNFTCASSSRSNPNITVDSFQTNSDGSKYLRSFSIYFSRNKK